MTALQVRLVWLEAISQNLRRIIEQGGDLSSEDSAFMLYSSCVRLLI